LLQKLEKSGLTEKIYFKIKHNLSDWVRFLIISNYKIKNGRTKFQSTIQIIKRTASEIKKFEVRGNWKEHISFEIKANIAV
jgi:hypothetical protein